MTAINRGWCLAFSAAASITFLCSAGAVQAGTTFAFQAALLSAELALPWWTFDGFDPVSVYVEGVAGLLFPHFDLG